MEVCELYHMVKGEVSIPSALASAGLGDCVCVLCAGGGVVCGTEPCCWVT